MFKVFLDGVYHSTHETFTDACRYARNQAAINQAAYFTVFEAGEDSSIIQEDNLEFMQGVPDYIITPHSTVNTARRASPVLRATTTTAYSSIKH